MSKKIREMTDAEIGSHVRKMMEEYPKQFDSQIMCSAACGRILCAIAAEMNAGELKFTIEEATYKGKSVGDFVITVKRK